MPAGFCYYAALSRRFHEQTEWGTYSNGDTPENFAVSLNSSGSTKAFNIQGGAFKYTNAEGSLSLDSATTQVTNLGPAASANNFTLSSTLNILSATGGSVEDVRIQMGLGALGTSAGSFGVDDTSNFYWANYTVASRGIFAPLLGTLELSGGGVNGTTDTLTVDLSKTYTLTLQGTYDLSGILTLNFSISDGTLTKTVTLTDTTPLTGEFFGYRNRISDGGSGKAVDANFDNFAIVPEPGTVSILIVGGLSLFVRLRSRRSR